MRDMLFLYIKLDFSDSNITNSLYGTSEVLFTPHYMI